MDKNKLIIIIGAILISLSIVLSGVSVLMMSSALKKLDGETEELEGEEETVSIPISQQVPFELENSIISTYSSKTTDKVMNVSLKIGFGLDSENKAHTDVLTLLDVNKGMIRDRIAKLLANKSYEYMEQDGVEEILQKEILELVVIELDTDAIVEVYFPDGLLKSIRK